MLRECAETPKAPHLSVTSYSHIRSVQSHGYGGACRSLNEKYLLRYHEEKLGRQYIACCTAWVWRVDFGLKTLPRLSLTTVLLKVNITDSFMALHPASVASSTDEHLGHHRPLYLRELMYWRHLSPQLVTPWWTIDIVQGLSNFLTPLRVMAGQDPQLWLTYNLACKDILSLFSVYEKMIMNEYWQLVKEEDWGNVLPGQCSHSCNSEALCWRGSRAHIK